MQRILCAVLIGIALTVTGARAADMFGFRAGMSKVAVQNQVEQERLGTSKWFGGSSLLVQAQDSERHSYIFNFCNDKLSELTQTFPANFSSLTGLIDSLIQQNGQPMFVSAPGSLSGRGFERFLNLYWKLDDATYLRVMIGEVSYNVIYQLRNTCNKIPN